MADVFDKRKRSEVMSRIKSSHTTPELIVRQFLYANNFRYRLFVKTLPGKPDIVLKRYNTVVFVHGCFWHGHKGCKHFRPSKSRIMFWNNKIEMNRSRDKKQIASLKKQGWNVIVIWECELRKEKLWRTLDCLIDKIGQAI